MDAVIAAGDKIVYTEEERADAQAKLGEWYLKYLEASNPQNLSRRFIAVAVTGLWVFLIVLGVIMAILTGDTSAVSVISMNEDTAELTVAAFIFLILRDVVLQPFSIIVGFYFLTQLARPFMSGKEEQKK